MSNHSHQYHFKKWVFVLFFVLNILNIPFLQAQNIFANDKDCFFRLQTENGNRLAGYVLLINNQAYITNSNGEVTFPNCTRQNFDVMKKNVQVQGYKGAPLNFRNRTKNMVIYIPKNSPLPPSKVELDAIRTAQEQNKRVDEISNKLDNMGEDLDSVKRAKDELEKKRQADKEKHEIEQQKAKQENERIEKEKKIANERIQLLTIIMIVIVIAVGIGVYLLNMIWKANKILTKQKAEIEQKNNKIEELILNILPKEVADELSLKGTTETRYYDFTTVFFADIKGFSAFAKKVTPQQLIAELDNTFGKFDDITKKYNIERIKTIGDSYMCAGGVPNKNKTNPFDVVLASLEIQKWMEDEKKKRNDDFWEVRVGVHTGDLVAGVIGKTKFAYDIWGNTVNLASRMESTGIIGKVNVSETTYQLINPYFECTPRGEIEVKNMGNVFTYFVDRIKPEYASDKDGYLPNADLMLKLRNLG